MYQRGMLGAGTGGGGKALNGQSGVNNSQGFLIHDNAAYLAIKVD